MTWQRMAMAGQLLALERSDIRQRDCPALDPLPQPGAVALDHLVAGSVGAQAERIAPAGPAVDPNGVGVLVPAVQERAEFGPVPHVDDARHASSPCRYRPCVGPSVAGAGLCALLRGEPLHAGDRVSQTLSAVVGAVDMRAVGAGIVEDGAPGPEQAFVARQPAPPGRRVFGGRAPATGAAHDALVAPPVAFRVPEIVPQPVASGDMRAVLHDDLLETSARLGRQPLPAGVGGDAPGERVRAVEVEGMHALLLRPAEMRAPLPVEPAVGRLRKVLRPGIAANRFRGRRPDRGGLSGRIAAGLRGASAGSRGLSDGEAGLLCRLGLPVRVLPCGVSGPSPGRAQVLAGAGMHLAKLRQIPFADAGALGEKPVEGSWARAERCRLFKESAVPVDGLAESGARRHRVALFAGAGTELVPGCQNLPRAPP